MRKMKKCGVEKNNENENEIKYQQSNDDNK